jgi:hypothetical protein
MLLRPFALLPLLQLLLLSLLWLLLLLLLSHHQLPILLLVHQGP